LLPYSLAVFPDKISILSILFSVIAHDALFKINYQFSADALDLIRFADDDKIISPDMADKYFFHRLFADISCKQAGHFFDHFAAPGISVLIGKRLEIIKIHLT